MTRTMTVVVNNKEGLIIGQLPHSEKNTAGFRTPGAIVVLPPGASFVDSEQLAILRKNPGFDFYFKDKIPASAAPEQNPEKVGEFVLVQGKEVPVGKNGIASLAKLEPKEALQVIEEIFVQNELERLLKVESRDEVRVAIFEQIKRLNSPEEKPIRGAR